MFKFALAGLVAITASTAVAEIPPVIGVIQTATQDLRVCSYAANHGNPELAIKIMEHVALFNQTIRTEMSQAMANLTMIYAATGVTTFYENLQFSIVLLNDYDVAYVQCADMVDIINTEGY